MSPGGGSRIRTCDFRVMGPARTATPLPRSNFFLEPSESTFRYPVAFGAVPQKMLDHLLSCIGFVSVSAVADPNGAVMTRRLGCSHGGGDHIHVAVARHSAVRHVSLSAGAATGAVSAFSLRRELLLGRGRRWLRFVLPLLLCRVLWGHGLHVFSFLVTTGRIELPTRIL